jgi:hypothetical protein
MDPPLKLSVFDTTSLRSLHQLSRTWNMLFEDLGDLSERLSTLTSTATKLHTASFPHSQNAIESLHFLSARNALRRRWVTSFGERTKLIIGFVFSVTSQKDMAQNIRIGDLTGKIATETQRDNSSMITIATMTMLFLPATAISVRNPRSLSLSLPPQK